MAFISNNKGILTLVLGFVFSGCNTLNRETPEHGGSEVSADFSNVRVGDYSDRRITMDQCGGQTFAAFMKQTIYPAILEQAGKRQRSKLAGVKAGDGVELQLSSDVTTFHVAFPRSRRGGRSFGAQGRRGDVFRYVADASYSFYFRSLESAYRSNKSELRDFYKVILGILFKCDASGVDRLSTKYKRVAADFVAVYVAEQYRNLVAHRGKFKQEDWDNAHIQTTLLSSLHSGQSDSVRGMYQEKEFRKDTYYTWDCVYKKPKGNVKPRPMRMEDYTQGNHDCKRSGVGQTRGDWEMLTRAIGEYHENSSEMRAFQGAFNTSRMKTIKNGRRTAAYHNNPIDYAAAYITNNRSPNKLNNADAMVSSLVNFLMLIQEEAIPLTQKLLNSRRR